MQKNVQTTPQLDSSHTSKVMLKIVQVQLQQYMNRESPDAQVGFRKGRGTRDQSANIHRIIEKAGESQKNIFFALLTMLKPLTMWITTNCGKFLKRWEYQKTLPVSWETCLQIQNLTWNNQLVQNSESYDKVVCYHPIYLTYMQSTSFKVPG